MRFGRLEISSGALVVAALLFYLDRNGVTIWLALACTMHELGHWWAIWAQGGKVQCMRLSCVGAELRLSPASPLSPGGLVLAALAGPVVNLLLAGGSYLLARRGFGVKLYLFSGVNFGLACFNLLPAGWLDGGRALTGFLRWRRWDTELADRAVRIGSLMVTLLLFAVGGMLFLQSGGESFTLLLAGIWLLGSTFWESRKEKIKKEKKK